MWNSSKGVKGRKSLPAQQNKIFHNLKKASLKEIAPTSSEVCPPPKKQKQNHQVVFSVFGACSGRSWSDWIQTRHSLQGRNFCHKCKFSADGNHIGEGLQQESHYRFLSATPCVHTPHLALKFEPQRTARHITRVTLRDRQPISERANICNQNAAFRGLCLAAVWQRNEK